MAERLYKGLAASPGLLAGRFLRIAPPAGGRGQHSGADALRAAISRACEELAGIAARLGGNEAEVILAQLAFLEDEELARPAFEAIAAGADAAGAWRAALDAEIAALRESQDAYFRGRAADFQDIRDRVLAALRGEGSAPARLPAGTIVIAEDLPPSQLLAGNWNDSIAIALAAGSPNTHLALLARGRGIAMVVGLGRGILEVGGPGLVDGTAGLVYEQPDPATLAAARGRMMPAGARQPQGEHADAVTRDGTRIAVQFNLADPEELEALAPGHCDGIGLVRTELFLGTPERLQDEEFQLAAYRRVIDWADGRPVTFRTVDAGGDKPVEGYTIDDERNPFLGLRGIRLSLLRPELLRLQLRALARAAAHGDVRIMLPMVTVPEELDLARELLLEEVEGLARRGLAHALPPLGIMVEVPSAAVMPERFAADFYSIGSNDLAQYLFAADRANPACARLARADDPALLRLIGNVVRHGDASERGVSLCGEAASDPALIPVLLRAGLRSLSVQPGSAAAVKAAIAQVELGKEVLNG